MILDRVWMIVLPKNKGVVHALHGSNAEEAWENAIEVIAQHTTGSTEFIKQYLHREGYRARKVEIYFK